jgi:uncharacterized protein YndB with AHSA1/START domain
MTVRAKSSAIAIADTTEGLVLARVEIAAPPERVFKAITTDELTKWWGSADMYRTTKHTADLRVGGAWRSEGVGADGTAFHVGGEILEVDPPNKLVQTWKPSWEQGPASTVTWLLEATEIGTRVTVRHTGFVDPKTCMHHANGWERVLGWLFDHEAHANDDVRHFFVRLVAPRPTFLQDMTVEERDVMIAHADYWKRQLAQGSAIVFGPVADPAGAWGLGVIAARDEAALRAFEAGDPAITSKRGFRYEVLPMAQAVY